MAIEPKMNCNNCFYFKSSDEQGTQGQCRRNPPTVVYSPEDDTFMAAFPFIGDPETTYCGQCAIPVEQSRIQQLG